MMDIKVLLWPNVANLRYLRLHANALIQSMEVIRLNQTDAFRPHMKRAWNLAGASKRPVNALNKPDEFTIAVKLYVSNAQRPD